MVKFYSCLAVLLSGLFLISSCSKDDDNEETKEEVKDETSVTPDSTVFDQVAFLQNNIVEIDSVGNMVRRMNGVVLHAADSTVVYVGADDIEQAAEYFRSWLSSDTKVEVTLPSSTDLQADLKDSTGVVRGTAYFKADSEEGTLAKVTFSSDNLMKYFSTIVFLDNAAWPQNSISPYEVGDVITRNTAHDGEKEWLCIAKPGNGHIGYFVCLSDGNGKDTNGNNISALVGRCDYALPCHAKAVSDILKSDWDNYVQLFQTKVGYDLNKYEIFRVSEYKYFFFILYRRFINLKTGSFSWAEVAWRSDAKWMQYIQVYGFTEIIK